MEVKSESKYERLRKIGIGSYGVVFKCVNRQTGQVVAIKRYSENDTDPIIRKIAMREVRILRQLRHPNLIHLIEVFRRRRRLHLVFDYCELTVLDVIEKYADNCPLNLIRKIIWQTVNGLNYCHSHNCIHRDIKPENILINQAGVVKLCDFGFARTFAGSASSRQLVASTSTGPNKASANQWPQNEAPQMGNEDKENSRDRQALTEYVATRWYRAPELLIGESYYDTKIDIWAIGCVTAELMRGEPLWPGKTDFDQLCMTMSSLGQLTSGQRRTLLSQAIYDQASIDKLLAQTAGPTAGNVSLECRLPARIGQSGVDFVLTCLQMDPARRPTSQELLRHPYIHSVRMAQFVGGAGGYNSTSVGQQPSAALESASSRTHSVSSPGNPVAAAARSNSQLLIMAANSNSTSRRQLPQQIPRRLVPATPSGSAPDTKTSSIPVALATNQLAASKPSDRYKRKHPTSSNLLAHGESGSRSLVPIAAKSRRSNRLDEASSKKYASERQPVDRRQTVTRKRSQSNGNLTDDGSTIASKQLVGLGGRAQRLDPPTAAISSGSSTSRSGGSLGGLVARSSSTAYLPSIGHQAPRRPKVEMSSRRAPHSQANNKLAMRKIVPIV